MWQARSDEQARELEASLSHAITRQDTAAGELSALRDRSQQQVMMLESSLADTSTRLETADSEIRKVKKKLDLEHRLYMHTVQEVQSQVRIQDQRLGWTMMAAVFAMLLGTVAGAILIRDVQKNARILADMSRDVDQLRSTFEQPSAMQPLATVEEPASLPGVTTKVDIPQTDFPREPKITRPSSATSRKKPAATARRQPTNHYMLSSALSRARQAPGNRGEVVAPYIKEIMAKREANRYRQYVTNEENTNEENTANQLLITLPGGTQYRVVKNGNGKSPAPGDKVRVNYLAITPDGKVLTETYSSGEPVTLDTNAMEPHLREALLKMEEGAEWEVYIPARLSPKGAIKARDRLASRQKVYLIELLQVIKGNISENGQPR
jgi:FKBP-type peptidyl-prolyl cis-trans isomerase